MNTDKQNTRVRGLQAASMRKRQKRSDVEADESLRSVPICVHLCPSVVE